MSKFISLNTLNSKKFHQLFDVVFESAQGKNTDAKQQSPRQQIILFSNTSGWVSNKPSVSKKHRFCQLQWRAQIASLSHETDSREIF